MEKAPRYIHVTRTPSKRSPFQKQIQKFVGFDDKGGSGKISPLYPCNTDMPKRSPI